MNISMTHLVLDLRLLRARLWRFRVGQCGEHCRQVLQVV